MARKSQTEDATFAEIARTEPWLNIALARASRNLAKTNRAFAVALIEELLRAKDNPKRFIKRGAGNSWLDLGGISALVLVEQFEKELRISAGERNEEGQGSIPAELIRDDMEDVSARAFDLINEIGEARRQAADALERQRKATEKLALLLG